jgi:hypothetical protein
VRERWADPSRRDLCWLRQAVAKGWLDGADATTRQAFVEIVNAVVSNSRTVRHVIAAALSFVAMTEANLRNLDATREAQLA